MYYRFNTFLLILLCVSSYMAMVVFQLLVLLKAISDDTSTDIANVVVVLAYRNK